MCGIGYRVCRYGAAGSDVELRLGMVEVDTLSLHIYRDIKGSFTSHTT